MASLSRPVDPTAFEDLSKLAPRFKRVAMASRFPSRRPATQRARVDCDALVRKASWICATIDSELKSEYAVLIRKVM